MQCSHIKSLPDEKTLCLNHISRLALIWIQAILKFFHTESLIFLCSHYIWASFVWKLCFQKLSNFPARKFDEGKSFAATMSAFTILQSEIMILLTISVSQIILTNPWSKVGTSVPLELTFECTYIVLILGVSKTFIPAWSLYWVQDWF